MKHTRGPWTVEIISSYGHFSVEGEKERDIMDEEKLEADAKLIAAAPDLLEACKACWLNAGSFSTEGTREKLEAAIKKALE